MLRAHRNTDPRFSAVGEIIFDRAEKRNALTPGMLEKAIDEARALADDNSVRAILLRGEGAAFCAGFDLTMCKQSPDAVRDLLTSLSSLIRLLRRIEKPIVIAAHGAALGGGCALLGGADFVITDKMARLGYPVTRIGLSPAVNAPAISLRIGPRACRERLLDPEPISGEEARRLGLADLCVDLPEDVTPRAEIEAARLAQKPPHAFAATKRWLNELDGSLDDTAFDRALNASLALVGGAEERALLARLA